MSQNGDCVATAFSGFSITIGVLVLPFHLLMIKLLVIDLRLALPRHLIIFCLSVSDALQVFAIFFVSATVRVFSLKVDSDACHGVKSLLFFNVAATLAVSSLSITVLSVERYVACIHSFRLHEVFTRERVVYGIAFIWLIGIICGRVAVILTEIDSLKVIFDSIDFTRITTVIFVLPTTVVISVIQYRLLVFSRKKLRRVRHSEMFGREAESADWKRRQMKVTFVAGIIAIAYIVCMLPLGVSCVYELTNINKPSKSTPVIIRALALLNNLADPYIYGIGIVDTRRAILKNLQRMKALLARA